MTPNHIFQVKKDVNESDECINFTVFMASVIEDSLKKETPNEFSDRKGDEISFDSTYETLYNECLSLKKE